MKGMWEKDRGVKVKHNKEERGGQRPHCNECKEGNIISREPQEKINKKRLQIESIRTNYRWRGSEIERETQTNGEGRRSERRERKGEGNST